jgi:hypothetical protein
MGRGERLPSACVHQRDLSFLSKSMAIGPYLFGTVGGHDIPGVTAHGILLGEEFALPGKDTVILSEKLYTFCQTHENRPLSTHEAQGAMLPAPRVQKLSPAINVELVGG